jgi:formylglycine-generating enzyme required for sulfatase activity
MAASRRGAPVWWPSFSLGQPNLLGEPPKPSKEADSTPKRDADVAEAEAKRIAEAAKGKAEAPPDPALSVTPGSGKTFQDRLADGTSCPMCPEMVVVPAKDFTMGSTSSEIAALTREFPQDENLWKSEGPQRMVTISRPVAVGKFAVTFDQWDACVADGGCKRYQPADEGWGRGNRPVVNVNWDDAKAYAEWVSRKTGKFYRLLSEAEREYVTRATVSRQTPGANEGNPGDGTARTAGNCDGRVVRGGSWNIEPQNLRAAHRDGFATDRYKFVGFRLARTLDP